MPLYALQCNECGEKKEIIQSIMADKPRCECGGQFTTDWKVTRPIVHYNCTGFYCTDNRLDQSGYEQDYINDKDY